MRRQWIQAELEQAAPPQRQSALRRDLGRVAREELRSFHLRLALAHVLLAPLPMYVGGRVRAQGLRLAGFTIGPGTVFWGMPRISGPAGLYRHLRLGQHCWINIGCFFDLGDTITIGDRVALGHQTMILTTTHTIGEASRRAAAPQTQPVSIDGGAWIGARCTILPGVTIGTGAVVAAGAVVDRSVPSNTLAAGVPARVVKELD